MRLIQSLPNILKNYPIEQWWSIRIVAPKTATRHGQQTWRLWNEDINGEDGTNGKDGQGMAPVEVPGILRHQIASLHLEGPFSEAKLCRILSEREKHWSTIERLHVACSSTAVGWDRLQRLSKGGLTYLCAGQYSPPVSLAGAFGCLLRYPDIHLRSIHIDATLSAPSLQLNSHSLNECLQGAAKMAVVKPSRIRDLRISIKGDKSFEDLHHLTHGLTCPSDLAALLLSVGGPLCRYNIGITCRLSWGEPAQVKADSLAKMYTLCVRREIEKILSREDYERGWKRVEKDCTVVREEAP
jgi:hypothetical protein